MDRSELASLLSADDEACSMARRALAAGAEFDSPRGCVSAAELADTYRARNQITAEQGIATVGLAEAVTALRAAGTSRVAIGGIGGQSYGWYFVIFTHHDSGGLLACTGVAQRHR